MKKKILIVLAIVFVIIQFFRIDKTVPSYDMSKDLIVMTQPSPEVERILRIACYDCHSYETAYPFYTNIAPFSWWIKGHINEGRAELNYSTWGDFPVKKLGHMIDESSEKVIEKKMPLTPYWMLHWDAKLTEEERKTLGDWFKTLEQ